MHYSKKDLSLFTNLPAILCVAALLSGCSAEPSTEISAQLPPAPAAKLSPEFKLLNVPMYKYSINGVQDKEGRVHLIVGKSLEVRHLVIGPRGVATRESISKPFVVNDPGNPWPATVDISFDRAGNLHALADAEHFVEKHGKWVGGQRTPWNEAGIKPYFSDEYGAGFVRGTRGLTWFFSVNSSDIGLPLTIVPVTGGMGLPAPAPTYHSRPVVVPEEELYRHWYAPGMEANTSVSLITPVRADQSGAIHVFYDIPFFSGGEYRHGSFRLGIPCPKPQAKLWYVRKKVVPRLGNGTPVCPLQGGDYLDRIYSLADGQSAKEGAAKSGRSNRVPGELLALAMDPTSGDVLWAGKNGFSAMVADHSRRVVLAELPIKNIQLVLAPAGRNRFHALAISEGMTRHKGNPLFYLEYANGKWSAPVEIGTYPPDPVFLRPDDRHKVFRIIPDNHGRALLIWPHEDALVARWVTLKK